MVSGCLLDGYFVVCWWLVNCVCTVVGWCVVMTGCYSRYRLTITVDEQLHGRRMDG